MKSIHGAVSLSSLWTMEEEVAWRKVDLFFRAHMHECEDSFRPDFFLPEGWQYQHCFWITVAGGLPHSLWMPVCFVCVAVRALNDSSTLQGTLWFETSNWGMQGSTPVLCKPRWTAFPSLWTWLLEVSHSILYWPASCYGRCEGWTTEKFAK